MVRSLAASMMEASLLVEEIGSGLGLLARGVREAMRGEVYPTRARLRSTKELQDVVEGSILATKECTSIMIHPRVSAGWRGRAPRARG